jgi:hypothetical protein
MDGAVEQGRLARAAPALLLAFLAPTFAEVLPGATRFSSLFVFPIELAVWGGGAVMARGLVRKLGLGWWSLLLLGLALANAEEFLIQQTSLAPLVIRLKGETWARAGDLNYVYAIWALVYESVWVVLLPTLAAEMIFPLRRHDPWLSRAGAAVTGGLFVVGCCFAWFTWTQIARTQVFHQPPYSPSLPWVAAAVVAILLLIVAAVRFRPRPSSCTLAAPSPLLVALLGGVWAVLWFGLVVLAFGIAPRFPPLAAVGSAMLIVCAILAAVPRWAADAGWSKRHDYALVAGPLCGSMAVSFFAFQGAAPADLLFKIIVDCLAVVGLVWLARRVLRRN